MTIVHVAVVCLSADGPVIASTAFGMTTKHEPLRLIGLLETIARAAGFEVQS